MKKTQKVTRQIASLWRQYQLTKPNQQFWKAYEKAFREAKSKRQLPSKPTFITSEEAYAHPPKKEFNLTLKRDFILLEDYAASIKVDWLEMIFNVGVGLAFWILGLILGLINRTVHLLYRGVFRLFGQKIPLRRIPVKFASDHIWLSDQPRPRKIAFKNISSVRLKREYLVINDSYYLVMLDEWGKPIPETQAIVDLLKLIVKENEMMQSKPAPQP